MGPLALDDLPEQALLLIDSAHIINVLEGHPKFGARFKPLFEAPAARRLRFAVTTITIAEVLTGPLQEPMTRWRADTEQSSNLGSPLRLMSTSRRALHGSEFRSGSGSRTPFRWRALWRSTRRP